MNQSPPALPDGEWKFDDIPEGEIEACFWWEYVRTGLNEGLRAELTELWRTEPRELIDGVVFPKNTVSKRFVVPSVLWEFTRWNHPFVNDANQVCTAYAAQFFFERRPWRELPLRFRKDIVSGFPYSAFAAFVQPMASFRDMFERTVRADGLARALEWFDFKPFRLERIEGLERERVVGDILRVYVDWRFKNEEILGEIRRALERQRPHEWPEKARPYRRALFPDYFSAETWLSALGWLGVLRRSRCGCPWRDFSRVYGTKTDEHDLRKEARYAKAIIMWMGDSDLNHLACLPMQRTRKRRAKS